jgi:serine/threonine protein kinase
MNIRARSEAMNEVILLKKVNILNQLDNPYVVKYYKSFIENNYLNIIMEYCDGGDLSSFIKGQFSRPIDEKKIWKYFI